MTNDSSGGRRLLLSGRRSGFYVFKERIEQRIAERRAAAWPWILVAVAMLAWFEALAP